MVKCQDQPDSERERVGWAGLTTVVLAENVDISPAPTAISGASISNTTLYVRVLLMMTLVAIALMTEER